MIWRLVASSSDCGISLGVIPNVVCQRTAEWRDVGAAWGRRGLDLRRGKKEAPNHRGLKVETEMMGEVERTTPE